jgi:hypothetical protein
MSWIIRTAVSACLVSIATTAEAQITFTFEDNTSAVGSFLHLRSTGSIEVDGLTITATAFAPGDGETFWSNSADFGVNADGGEDTADEFDVDEGMTFYFDHDVTLTNIDVGTFGGADEGTIAFDGGAAISSITATGLTTLGDTYVASGTVLRFTAISGSFTLDGLTVSAVPEPSTGAALAGLVGFGFAVSRRRRSPGRNLKV